MDDDCTGLFHWLCVFMFPRLVNRKNRMTALIFSDSFGKKNCRWTLDAKYAKCPIINRTLLPVVRIALFVPLQQMVCQLLSQRGEYAIC